MSSREYAELKTEIQTLRQEIAKMALNFANLQAIVAKLVIDVPNAVANAEAAAQQTIDKLTQDLTALDQQIAAQTSAPPASPSA